MSSSVRSEGEYPFSGILVEKLMDEEGPPKPAEEVDRQTDKQTDR